MGAVPDHFHNLSICNLGVPAIAVRVCQDFETTARITRDSASRYCSHTQSSNAAPTTTLVERRHPSRSHQLDDLLKTLPNKQILDIISNRWLLLTTETYTSIGEAISLHRVTDLFSSAGKGISLKQSRTVSSIHELRKSKN